MVMRLLGSLVLVASLAACVTEADVKRDERLRRDYAHFERVGPWVITCTDFRQAANGKMVPYNSCSLRRVFNRRTGEGGNALVVTAVHGREVIVAPPGDRHCHRQPTQRMIDQVPVRLLPYDRQIGLLHSGRVYAEEFMPRTWPECWIVVRKARLDGFTAAHERFRLVARGRGALWPPLP